MVILVRQLKDLAASRPLVALHISSAIAIHARPREDTASRFQSGRNPVRSTHKGSSQIGASVHDGGSLIRQVGTRPAVKLSRWKIRRSHKRRRVLVKDDDAADGIARERPRSMLAFSADISALR